MEGVAEGSEGSEEGGVPQREGGSGWSRSGRGRGGSVGTVVIPAGGVRVGGSRGSRGFVFVLGGGSLREVVSQFFWDQRSVGGCCGLARGGFIIVIEAVGSVVVVVECVQRRVNGVLERNGRRETRSRLYDLVLLPSDQKSRYTLCFRPVTYLPPSAYHPCIQSPSTPALY